jgi:hypothetical protein
LALVDRIWYVWTVAKDEAEPPIVATVVMDDGTDDDLVWLEQQKTGQAAALDWLADH